MIKWWEKIKEHPIYSKVVAGLILAGLLAILNKSFAWNIFSSIFSFFTKEYIIPIWGLMVIGIIPVVLIIGVIIFKRRPEHIFIPELGIWEDKKTGNHFCPRCKTEGKPSPLYVMEDRYHCYSCRQQYAKPGYQYLTRRKIISKGIEP